MNQTMRNVCATPVYSKRKDRASPRYPSAKVFSHHVCSISTVYRATCSLTKAPVIIKAYQKAKMKEKNFLRMEREIRLMRLLEGEVAIVQLYNVFEDTGFKYLVMETCKGGDLFKAMLLRGGKMDERWVCNEVSAVGHVADLPLKGPDILQVANTGVTDDAAHSVCGPHTSPCCCLRAMQEVIAMPAGNSLSLQKM